jgi:23S rRNA (guanosine2251-2'-O)-methyltransferase
MNLLRPEPNNREPVFEIRQCGSPTCRLRFTVEQGSHKGEICPACRTPTFQAEENFGRAAVAPAVGHPTGPVLEVVLDNIRSAWNVGAMLRTSDGAGVRKVHLCGVSATPDNPKVAKTALGAERSMPWYFHPDGVAAAQELKAQGFRLWALEGGPRAESLFAAAVDMPGPPLALVAGNELSGVDPGILRLCDRVVCLPMHGIKGSLNVAVAFGIAVYTIRFGWLGG